MSLDSISNLHTTVPQIREHRLKDTGSDTSPYPVETTTSLSTNPFNLSTFEDHTTWTNDPLVENDIFMVDEHTGADLAALDSFELFPDITPTNTTVSSESDIDSSTDTDSSDSSCKEVDCKEVDATLGKHDVIAQRGGLSNKHSGTKAYRVKGIKMRSKYQKAPSKALKTKLSQSLVDWVHQKGGRFVKKDKITGEWQVMSDKKARIKTAQFLRTRPKRQTLGN